MKYFTFLVVISLVTSFLNLSDVKAQSNQNPSQPRLTQVSPQYYAQRQRGGRDGDGRIMQQLNLSDEQTQQLAQIRQKYQQKIQPIRQQMQSKRQELNQLMSGDASENTIRSKHQEINRLREQLTNLRFESMLEMRQVLTPEQRREFAQLMEQRQGNMRTRRNPNSNSPNAPINDSDDFMP